MPFSVPFRWPRHLSSLTATGNAYRETDVIAKSTTPPGRVRARLALAAALFAILGASEAARAQTFEMVEPLGHAWRGERVSFPLSGAGARPGPAHVVDGAGQPVPAEIVEDGAGRRLEVLADLKPFEKRTLRLAAGGVPANPLHIEERDGLIEIAGPESGVAIRLAATGPQGPLAAIRGQDGRWMPALWSLGGRTVAAYAAQVERHGPVAAVVRTQTRLSDGTVWTLRATVQAGDAAVLFEEHWSAPDHAAVAMTLADPSLDRFTWRIGSGPKLGRVTTQERPANGDLALDIAPWLHWWLSEKRAIYAVASSGRAGQAVTVAALHPERWVAPNAEKPPAPPAPVVAALTAQGLALRFPAAGSSRDWLLAVTTAGAALDRALDGQPKAPPAQGFVIRNGDFPLSRVLAATAAWPAGSGPRPRLILTADDMRDLYAPQTADPARRDRVLRAPLTEYSLADHVDILLRTRDPAVRARLTAAAPDAMQAAVDRFLAEDEPGALGSTPHHRRELYYAVHLADFALADPALDPRVAARLRVQAAFLADTVSRSDFASPERGFAANPNIVSGVAATQGLLACLLSDHPKAGAWLDSSLKELHDTELLTWSDKDGGWLEAPHYGTLSVDFMLAVFLCARNAGFPQALADPRLRQVMRWFAQITTPPDERLAGARHLPPIGNTYMLEPTGLFGTAAFIWRKADPAFSAEMQAMHRASGVPAMNGVGGWWPATGAYQLVFKDTRLPSRAPDYGSALFANTGAMLRAHMGTRETQLYLIAGGNHAHYDNDSGSITLWAKGRLLSDAFGYTGFAPAADHSMIDNKAMGGLMRVTAWSSQPPLDYVRATHGPWTRQILFVKDRDPLAPNYFLLRDDLSGAPVGRSASGDNGSVWRLWLNADRIEFGGNHALVIGKDDVDMDIFFLAGAPAGATIEKATRTSLSSALNKPYATTQSAIRIPLAPTASLPVLLYPRLKTQAPPRVTPLSDGRGVRIETQGRTDIVYLGNAPFADGGVFEGTAALAIERGGQTTLALGAPGMIARGSLKLEGDKAQTRSWP